VARRHREIVDVLLARILDGRYPVGGTLPKEEALKAEFDVARGTVREAMRALEERRVATVRHGRAGATVRAPEEWDVLDPLVGRALAGGPGRRRFARELDEYRTLLESEAAALAAERASARQRDELRAAARELGDADDVLAAARRLRRLIAVAARNRPLASGLRALGDAGAPAGRPPAVTRLIALAEAVASGDADRARLAARGQLADVG
jgi:GntR family transcriptional regulator, galactonate operon transcriptional repressor